MKSIKLKTGRLELISGSLELSEAEISDINYLSQKLDAQVPYWPPPLNDENSMRFFTGFYKQNPRASGWAVWYIILPEETSGRRILIGNAGFKGLPDVSGTVEIGYSLLEEYQNNGFATEAVGRLISWAFDEMKVKRIIAETFPEQIRSIRVMVKNNFTFIGEGSEPGVVRYELTSETYFSRK